MPGTYIVANRNAPTATGSLLLPVPRAQGPIVLPEGKVGLEYRFVDKPAYENVQTFGQRVYTDGISDCVVLYAVETDPATYSYTNFCFRHLAGGLYKPWRDDFRTHIGQPAHCLGLIAARDLSGTDVLKDKMIKWGIPAARITVYISGQVFNGPFAY
jgi:hypothetical protein